MDFKHIEFIKKSVSDGKSSIASAITNNGVATLPDATFDTMKSNINTACANKYNSGYSAGANSAKAIKFVNAYFKVDVKYAGKVTLLHQAVYDCNQISSFLVDYNVITASGQSSATRRLYFYGSNDAASWNQIALLSSAYSNYGINVSAYKYLLITEELNDETDTTNWGITWESNYIIHSVV